MAKWKEIPSPEAIVQAALERAAENYIDEGQGVYILADRILADLNALAYNPAEVAAIISAAAQLNKERKGEALTSEARSDEEDRG
jgi:hypothetical protein